MVALFIVTSDFFVLVLIHTTARIMCLALVSKWDSSIKRRDLGGLLDGVFFCVCVLCEYPVTSGTP